MAFNLVDVLATWEQIGIFEVVLPFLLVFTITFAILEKAKILGEKRNINIAIALVSSLLFVRNGYLVGVVNRFLPNVSLFMIVIIMFLLLVGVFGGTGVWSGGLLGVAALVSFVFVIWALSSDFIGDNFTGIPNWWIGITEEAKATIVFIGIFIVIIWLVTREKKEKRGGIGDFFTKFGNSLKGN